MNGHKLLIFVCTGNICRSPMAEYLLRDLLPEDSQWEIYSAGMMAQYGMPASEPAAEALDEKDIDLSTHMSRPISRAIIEESSLVVGMTESHCDQLKKRFPEVADNVFLLKSFTDGGGGDLEDPIGASIDVYRRIRDEIAGALSGLILKMNNMQE